MTQVDDLKIGMCVVLVGCKTHMVDAWGREIEPDYNGWPVEILEISLPFLCVTDGQRNFAIDVRRWEVIQVTKRYVECMRASAVETVQKFTKTKTSRRYKKKPHPNDCPRCGCRMRQKSKGQGEYRWFCPDCDYEGGVVAKPGVFA